MPDVSDTDLVGRAQEGDVDAVGELYDRHHRDIFRYLWARLHNVHSAEDLTAEVFVRMVTHLPRYQPRGVPFRSWLYRIAHNLMVDHHRKRGKANIVPLYYAEGISEGGHDPVSATERQLTLERVEAALRQIDPTQCEVVVLRFLIGLSLREVATTLDKSVAAVKSLQHRGLIALRAALEKGAYEVETPALGQTGIDRG